MADAFISKQKSKENGLTVTQCLHIFGLSRSGYYAWVSRREDKTGKQEAKQDALNEIKEKFRQIVRRLGYVPGKRAFQTYMWRDYGVSISIKRCRKIMKAMSLVANKPKRDAYKHQATHNHECASPDNAVKQNFYIGPRKVVLTDITYLYYGPSRTPIYLCAFRDAYTKEILGHSVDTNMDTELVKSAFGRMIENHGNELHGTDCCIHSDQGSQYLSTSFQRILDDSGFVQSVSGRGNSQDNAPMESFFGRMKCTMLDLIALCPNAYTAQKMISGYIDAYNNKHYQYALAGLTPSEYYTYVTTGIYPVDNYYGVEATELMPIGALVQARLDTAAEKARKVREARAKKRKAENRVGRSPAMIVARDQRILKREISKWKQSKRLAIQQISHLEQVLEKAQKAGSYLISAPRNVLMELEIAQNWKNYPELDYIFEMKELF